MEELDKVKRVRWNEVRYGTEEMEFEVALTFDTAKEVLRKATKGKEVKNWEMYDINGWCMAFRTKI